MKLIRATDMKEGRWRNGMGVSWDIAAWPEGSGSGDFGWRFALARIDADVPFSSYPGIDRFFTLVEGEGLDLDFADDRHLAVDKPFVPHFYACDIGTFCRVRAGPCRALNLFLKRSDWRAEVEIVRGSKTIDHDGPILLYALDGKTAAGDCDLDRGDAAVTAGRLEFQAGSSHLYVARLFG